MNKPCANDFLSKIIRAGFIQKHSKFGGFYLEVTYHRKSYSLLGEADSSTIRLLKEFDLDYNKSLEDMGEVSPGYTKLVQNIWEAGDPQLLNLRAREALNKAFNVLFRDAFPKVVVTSNGHYLTHAGITIQGPFHYLTDSENIPKPDPFDCIMKLALPDKSYEQKLIKELTWSDVWPSIDGISKTSGREEDPDELLSGIGFGSKALDNFLDLINCKFMIRGHQAKIPNGAKIFADGSWSCGNSATVSSNRGNYLVVDLTDSSETFSATNVRSIID